MRLTFDQYLCYTVSIKEVIDREPLTNNSEISCKHIANQADPSTVCMDIWIYKDHLETVVENILCIGIGIVAQLFYLL